MGIFPSLRVLGTLRRIAKALEEANMIEKAKLSREDPILGELVGFKRRRGKMVEISAPTAKEWNERWRADHPPEEEEA